MISLESLTHRVLSSGVTAIPSDSQPGRRDPTLMGGSWVFVAVRIGLAAFRFLVTSQSNTYDWFNSAPGKAPL